MNVDVMVNGRPWKVAVEPAEQAGKFTVTIKGKSRVVDASWIDADTLSLIDGSKSREIRLHPRADNGGVGVEIAGRLFDAVVAKRPGATGATGAMGAPRALDAVGASGAVGAPSAPGAVGAVGAVGAQAISVGLGASVGLGFSQAIKAPMPGRVVRVLVAVGDRVTAKQPVVVVEAMKMENELRSPRDGMVKEIAVAPGAAVESGAVLVVIGD